MAGLPPMKTFWSPILLCYLATALLVLKALQEDSASDKVFQMLLHQCPECHELAGLVQALNVLLWDH